MASWVLVTCCVPRPIHFYIRPPFFTTIHFWPKKWCGIFLSVPLMIIWTHHSLILSVQWLTPMIFDWFETICTFNYHVTPSYSSAISLKLKAWDMITFVNFAEKIKTTYWWSCIKTCLLLYYHRQVVSEIPYPIPPTRSTTFWYECWNLVQTVLN